MVHHFQHQAGNLTWLQLLENWTWIEFFLKFDFEAWIKIFKCCREGKFGVGTWKEFEVVNGNKRWTFEVIAYEGIVFFEK